MRLRLARPKVELSTGAWMRKFLTAVKFDRRSYICIYYFISILIPLYKTFWKLTEGQCKWILLIIHFFHQIISTSYIAIYFTIYHIFYFYHILSYMLVPVKIIICIIIDIHIIIITFKFHLCLQHRKFAVNHIQLRRFTCFF